MKKIVLVITSLIIIVLTIVCIILSQSLPDEAKVYIENKKYTLRHELAKYADSIMIHKYKDVFPLYFGCKSRFVSWNNSESQTGDMFKDLTPKVLSQLKLPDDIVSLYHVAPEDPFVYSIDGFVEEVKREIRMKNIDNDGEPSFIRQVGWKGIWQTGWALGARENWGNGKIIEYMIIPYAVAFRKQSFGSIEGYVSIDDALENAFYFYTRNDNSDIKRNYVPNVGRFLWNPQKVNEYYYYEKSKENRKYGLSDISQSSDYSQYMYNDYYYVFIRAYYIQAFEPILIEDNVESDKKEYVVAETKHILYREGVCILLFVVIWIICLFSIIKECKERKQTILQRIIVKCSPKKFVRNYNREKLKSANDIYSKAISIDVSNLAGIMELASRAENELGIVLVTKNDLKALKALCNPKRFMKPYDAEKVAKANALYAHMKERKLSYAEYIQIKRDIDVLYNDKGSA